MNRRSCGVAGKCIKSFIGVDVEEDGVGGDWVVRERGIPRVFD